MGPHSVLASPGFSALGARLTYEDAPLVGGPADEEAPAVGAVPEGIGLVAIALEVLEGRGDELVCQGRRENMQLGRSKTVPPGWCLTALA